MMMLIENAIVNNPGKKLGYVENVDNATMALERLKEIVDSMKTVFLLHGCLALKEVLQLREMLSQKVVAAMGDKA